jgi:hypothetical protein
LSIAATFSSAFALGGQFGGVLTHGRFGVLAS